MANKEFSNDDKNRNTERRKAAMRFLTSIPMDIRSIRELHKERMLHNNGGQEKGNKLTGSEDKTASTQKVQTNDEGNDNIHPETAKLISEPARMLSSISKQRLKYQRAVTRIKHLKPKSLNQKSNTTNITTRRRSKRMSGSRPLSMMSADLILEVALSIEGVKQPGKEEEVSYKSLLEQPSNIKTNQIVSSELENPEWKSGSHRTVLTFPSYMVSVIDYTKPTELKKDLNARFHEKFPQVNITLSKCRSLKLAIQRIANIQGLDRSVTERALSYFDRLVMCGKVIKSNRRHCAGVCLLLSAKVNMDLRSAEISRLISRIEHDLKVGRHPLVLFEFPVFAALQFFLINFP